MKTIAKTRTYYGEYTLEHWISLILSENIILPEYQRSFAWNKDKVKSFLASLVSGDYIPPVTIAAGQEGGKDANLILDGQQRLTSILFAALGYMPCRKAFPMNRTLADDEQDGEVGENVNLEEQQEADVPTIDWSMRYMLCHAEHKDLNTLRQNLDKEDKLYEKTELLEGTEVDFMKLHLGFLYIVPSGSTNDSQQLFSKLFRSINYDGVSLSKEESRKALYYQNPAFSNFFEGKMDNGEYVLCNLSIAVGAVGSKSVDWLRYLSILSRYSVNAEEVLKGYRKESSREDFYTDYVAYIINLPLKGDNQMFDGVREKAPYKDGIWKKRYPILQKEIQRLQAHMYSPDRELFPSWIDADYWLFGLIYYVLFEGKTLTDGCEDRLKSSIQSKIKAAKNDSKHLDRPNQLSFLRKRLQQSLKIYKSNVS